MQFTAQLGLIKWCQELWCCAGKVEVKLLSLKCQLANTGQSHRFNL